MHAHARARWDIQGPGEGSYDATFKVTERVTAVEAGGAIVSVDILPERIEEAGLPAPGAELRTFSVEVAADGRVIGVRKVNGISASALDPEQLALLGTYRPPLPAHEVRLGDEWTSAQTLELPSISQELMEIGRLQAFRRDGASRIAELEYSGTGPLQWHTALPQGVAQLDGTGTTRTTADFDIDAGSLQAGRSLTNGTFSVRVQGTGSQAPITGSLHLELRLSIDRT
jgi:hypothetical protein